MMLKQVDGRMGVHLQASLPGAAVTVLPLTWAMLWVILLDHPDLVDRLPGLEDGIFIEPGPLYDELYEATLPQELYVDRTKESETLVSMELHTGDDASEVVMYGEEGKVLGRLPASARVRALFIMDLRAALPPGQLPGIVLAQLSREGRTARAAYLDGEGV